LDWLKNCLFTKGPWRVGVRQMREFNIALLGKWYWMMLVDRGGIWFRVLVAYYGVEGGKLKEGGQFWSTWCREIAKIHDEAGGVRGGWLEDSVSKKVEIG